MAASRQQSIASKIFDNVMFLAEVFGDRPDREIPKIPVLEMAQCFDLTPPREPMLQRRRRDWPLWK